MLRSTFRLTFLCLAFLFCAVTLANAAEETSHPPSKKIDLLARHLRFLSMDGYNQYRYADTAPSKIAQRDLMYKVSTVMRLSLIGEDRTYIQWRGESGRSFTSSYDYAGVGLHPGYWSFNMKSLFIGQKIGAHFEAQAGSLEYDRGAGTEATYADNDAWLEGYRLHFTSGGSKYIPDLSATVGYAGDFTQPNMFARFHRMEDENYMQFLADKHFGMNREVSAEMDSIQAIRYTREALHLQKLPLVVVDEMIAETMTRASDNPTFGWSGTLFKTLDRKGRVRLGAFVSDMPKGIFVKDNETIFLNGDFYVLGQRFGPNVRFIPIRNLELGLMGSTRTDNTPSTRYRGQVTVCYHFASLFNRALR
ncbi:MAG TPA: hypothetical protein VMB18_11195 [Terriglobales bacterium]|nr:hypothetical protein [Terriglobales bacterium]